MAALQQHGAAAERQQPLGLLTHLRLVARQRSVEQRSGFRQIGGYDQGPGKQRAAQRLHAVPGKEPVPRRPHHHRIHHAVRAPAVGSVRPVRWGGRPTRAAAAWTAGARASVLIFTAATARSENTASIWAVMNDGGTSWMPVTPRVFCAVSAVITEAP